MNGNNNLIDSKLNSGRNVKVRELSLDEIADLNDIANIIFTNGAMSGIRNLNTAKLAWLRAGLGGGDFEGWSPNGQAPPDSVLKQLSEAERDELVEVIKNSQYITKKKNSSSV